MKYAIVALLLCAIFAYALAKRNVPCFRLCVSKALEEGDSSKKLRECARQCIKTSFGRDDVSSMLKRLNRFKKVLKEDVQDKVAELPEEAQKQVVQEAKKEQEEEVESDSENPTNGANLVTTTRVNVRNGPCTSNSIVTTLSAGATVRYTGQARSGCGYTWYSISGSFGSGWIASSFVRVNGGGSTGGGSTGGGSTGGSSCRTRNYPLFKQCDNRWGGDRLGSSSTICKVGCLMSSVAMAMNGLGKRINGAAATPQSLNSFLRSNGGYSGNLFVWGAVSRFGLSYLGQPTSIDTIKQHICANRVVILNVNRGGHWVLATGFNGNTFNVHDPGYTKSTYAANEVVRAGVFSV